MSGYLNVAFDFKLSIYQRQTDKKDKTKLQQTISFHLQKAYRTHTGQGCTVFTMTVQKNRRAKGKETTKRKKTVNNRNVKQKMISLKLKMRNETTTNKMFSNDNETRVQT